MQAPSVNTVRKLFVCLCLGSVLSACASGPPSYELNILTANSGRGNVMIRHLDGDVVLLNGWVESVVDRNAVMRAALKGEKKRKVINQIQVFSRD